MERWHVVCVLDWTFFLPLAPTKRRPLAHRPPPLSETRYLLSQVALMAVDQIEEI